MGSPEGTTPNIYEKGVKSARYASDHKYPDWDETSPHLYNQMKSLIEEKDKLELDKQKIQTKPGLMPRDRKRVMRGAENLSKTIESLISKSKDRLSEYYDSKLKEKS